MQSTVAKLWRIFAAIGTIAFLVITTQPTLAQEKGRGFTITPPIFELSANPGEKRSEVISLYNQGEEDLTISVNVENLVPIGEAGQVQIVSGDTEEKLPSLKDWLTVDKKEFSLRKGATQNVGFDLSLPQNAPPGGHFASIVFSSAGSMAGGDNGAGVSAKIGALVLLSVSGDINENARVATFEPARRIYFQNGTVDFNLRVENKGNVYVRPRGFLVINNVFGRKIAQIEVDGKNILPAAIRKIPTQFAGKRLFGPYTVTLALTYGASNKTLNATTGFWVIPWIPTLIVVVVLIVIIIFRKRIGRALKILFGKENS